MTNSIQSNEVDIEEIIIVTVSKTIQAVKGSFVNEWMTLKEGAKYANVSHNTFTKFRTMGLKVCEVDGIKRVSRKEIDTFLENHSY